ncbi:armadillo-type protein [Zychaea mexicana]|uniref:armadillo-type protein n=1 Tax=Zychaea mexicana TaxID=64656 RepID=UPI0022FE9EBE|nr:armadillo-type protein [Zychaea mexicana]KAI9499526.1 armadillo-type protein [Zychaea mexicana]
MKRSTNEVDSSFDGSEAQYVSLSNDVRNGIVALHSNNMDYMQASGADWNQLRLTDLESSNIQLQIQCLRRISTTIPILMHDQQQAVLGSLLQIFRETTSEEIKGIVMSLVQKFMVVPQVNGPLLFKDLVLRLSSSSTSVRTLLYNCIYDFLKARQLSITVENHKSLTLLYEKAVLEFEEPDYRVRAACIRLYSLLPFVFKAYAGFQISVLENLSEMKVQKLISRFVRDNDPRVRKSALDSLVDMHLRGSPLYDSLYSLAVVSLRDDFEEVRLGGLNLIWAVSSLNPDILLWLPKDGPYETVRLIDDAFSKICDLVNDVSVVIRTKACVIMSSYQHVNADILSQTFSKQIMSRLRRRFDRKRQRKHEIIPVAEGDMDVETEEFRIMDSGACGAFVHGLEDEFQEVRNASIDSICELCMYNGHLVNKAVDALVDMFNDEIPQVRINAINSLRKIGTRWPLKFDIEQLEISAGTLDDFDQTTRFTTHDLLAVVEIENEESLLLLMTELMENIKRYPQDLLSIYRCIREVGKRHPAIVAKCRKSLFDIDNRYLTKEPSIESPVYTARVILLVNAVVSQPSLATDLPSYMFQHFAYYRRKYPDCVQDIRVLHENGLMKSPEYASIDGFVSETVAKMSLRDISEYTTTTSHLLQIVKRQAERWEYSAALATIQDAIKNYKYICTLRPSGNVRLAITYLECYELVLRIKQNFGTPSFASTAQIAATNLLQASYIMQYSFIGLSAWNMQAIIYFRILVSIVWTFGIIKDMPVTSSAFKLQSIFIAFVNRIDQMSRHLDKEIYQMLSIGDLRSILVKISTDPTAAKWVGLHSFLTGFLPMELDIDTAVKHTSAEITNPQPNPDKPLKFKSNIRVNLDVEAIIYNSSDIYDIAIEITNPDQSSQVYWPVSNDFIPTTPFCYKLKAKVELHYSGWTEPCNITLRIVRSFEPDLAGLDGYIMKYPNAESSNTHFAQHSQDVVSIPISDPVLYNIHPYSKKAQASSGKPVFA